MKMLLAIAAITSAAVIHAADASSIASNKLLRASQPKVQLVQLFEVESIASTAVEEAKSLHIDTIPQFEVLLADAVSKDVLSIFETALADLVNVDVVKLFEAALAKVDAVDIPKLVQATLAQADIIQALDILEVSLAKVQDADVGEVLAAVYEKLVKMTAPSLSPAELAKAKEEWYRRFKFRVGSKAYWIARIAEQKAEAGEDVSKLKAAFDQLLNQWLAEEDEEQQWR